MEALVIVRLILAVIFMAVLLIGMIDRQIRDSKMFTIISICFTLPLCILNAIPTAQSGPLNIFLAVLWGIITIWDIGILLFSSDKN